MTRTMLSAFLAYCLCGVVCAPGIYPEESCPEVSTITQMISSSDTVKAAHLFNFSKIKSEIEGKRRH